MGKRLGNLDKKVHPKLIIISVEEKAIHQLLYGYKFERLIWGLHAIESFEVEVDWKQ